MKISVADLTASSYWTLSASTDITSYFIISIDFKNQTTLLIQGQSFPAWDGAIVYNIQGKKDVIIDTAVKGSILAPKANAMMQSGTMTGYGIFDTIADIRDSNRPPCSVKPFSCGCCQTCALSLCKKPTGLVHEF